MTKQEINNTIKQYKDYQLMAKAAEREMEALKKKIIKHLEDKNLEVVEVDAGKASYKHIFSERFDSKKFSKENKYLYSMYTVATDTMRFQVQ